MNLKNSDYQNTERCVITTKCDSYQNIRLIQIGEHGIVRCLL